MVTDDRAYPATFARSRIGSTQRHLPTFRMLAVIRPYTENTTSQAAKMA